MTKEHTVITFDGPSAAGKGTISQMLAKKLNWHLLDSGALYRVLVLAALQEHVDFTDEAALTKLVSQLRVKFIATNKGPVRILLDERDITQEIRTETHGSLTSQIARVPAVRTALRQLQRAFLRAPGLVADGRDMGTQVFSDADLKFFLTARSDVRARRRFRQLKAQGIDVKLHTILEEIKVRDERDQTRKIAPLKPADDAIIIDTSDHPIEEVFQIVLEAAKKVTVV